MNDQQLFHLMDPGRRAADGFRDAPAAAAAAAAATVVIWRQLQHLLRVPNSSQCDLQMLFKCFLMPSLRNWIQPPPQCNVSALPEQFQSSWHH